MACLQHLSCSCPARLGAARVSGRWRAAARRRAAGFRCSPHHGRITTGRATIGTSGVRTSLSGASHGHIQSSEGTNDLVLTYLQNLSGQRLRAVFKEAAGETAGYEIPASLVGTGEAALSWPGPCAH